MFVVYSTRQLIFMTPPLLQTGVGSPSLPCRYGALRQRCAAHRRAVQCYISVSIASAAQVEIGLNIKMLIQHQWEIFGIIWNI